MSAIITGFNLKRKLFSYHKIECWLLIRFNANITSPEERNHLISSSLQISKWTSENTRWKIVLVDLEVVFFFHFVCLFLCVNFKRNFFSFAKRKLYYPIGWLDSDKSRNAFNLKEKMKKKTQILCISYCYRWSLILGMCSSMFSICQLRRFKRQSNNFDKFAEFQSLFVRWFVRFDFLKWSVNESERLLIICPRFIVASKFSHFLIINVNFQIPIDSKLKRILNFTVSPDWLLLLTFFTSSVSH